MPNRLDSIIPYNHQPTEVLNTAHHSFVAKDQATFSSKIPIMIIKTLNSLGKRNSFVDVPEPNDLLDIIYNVNNHVHSLHHVKSASFLRS